MNAAERGEVFERAAPFIGTSSGGRESLERDEALYSIEVCESFSATKNYWRALEGELATPYQSYDFLSLWFAHVGAKAGLRPCILVGLSRRKQPLFLLPLCVRTYAAWRIAQFMGGKHVNVNMGLWRPTLQKCDPHFARSPAWSVTARPATFSSTRQGAGGFEDRRRKARRCGSKNELLTDAKPRQKRI